MWENGSIVFLSDFFNHHLKPFSDVMYGKLKGRYIFIEVGEMPTERKNMGWSMDSLPPYVVTREMFVKERGRYQKMINEADAVITGVSPSTLIRGRFRTGKITFRYSERPLKKGLQLLRYPDRFIRWHRWNPRNGNIYMLCASAYTAGDYGKLLLFRDRCYKWGYFTQTRQYESIEDLIQKKKDNSLIWVARFIDFKHPEVAIEIAKRLKSDGYNFTLEMIGNGSLLDEIKELVRTEGLEKEIKFAGALQPEKVRDHMELAQIHLFTSDQQEGWGAVLNEAMNSGCVSVADKMIGAAPYLIEDGKNGFLYTGIDVLYEKIKYLLDNQDIRMEMAVAAYRTIVEQWNEEKAAEQFMLLAEQLIEHKATPAIPEHGICSIAERL